MALDKTFASGEILSAANVNGHLLGLWIPIDKRVIASGSPVASVSFASLDSNFRMFRLTYHVIPVGGLWLRFNNDSGSNYTQQSAGASNTTFSGNRLTPAIAADLAIGWPGNPMQGQMTISKISTAAHARAIGHLTIAPHADLQAYILGVSWNNAASLINRIDLIGNGGNYYGIVSLEGMRGA